MWQELKHVNAAFTCLECYASLFYSHHFFSLFRLSFFRDDYLYPISGNMVMNQTCTNGTLWVFVGFWPDCKMSQGIEFLRDEVNDLPLLRREHNPLISMREDTNNGNHEHFWNDKRQISWGNFSLFRKKKGGKHGYQINSKPTFWEAPVYV